MTFGNPDSLSPVEVLLPGALSHGFDYAVPEGMQLHAGDYVSVPFGSREVAGVVWGGGDTGRNRLRDVKAHHSHLPPMQKPMRDFLDWVAWYTFSSRGAVLKLALPVPEALKAPNKRERPSSCVATQVASAGSAPSLSAEQAIAAETLLQRLNAGFSVTLLDGITGSGKTEVYFDAMEKVLSASCLVPSEECKAQGTKHKTQLLVLLPEISLSVQWLERFKRRFGFNPHIWHSALSAGQRKHTWRAIAQGEARVVVGARSALFLPYRNLQLIVVDEEHESSYKQEDGVIYHARDMAVARARMEKIPIALVSATPSIETYFNVKTGKYAEVRLEARHGGASLPDVRMIDMRGAALERGAFIAQPLREALAGALHLKHQSMLFLNRRGYAPLVLCRHCGHRFQCPQCSSWLVMHRKGIRQEALGIGENTNAQCPMPNAHLRCHHCGFSIPSPKGCPACNAENSLFPCRPAWSASPRK